MPRATDITAASVQNPQLPWAALTYSPLNLDASFPLDIVIDGERDDAPITRLYLHDALELGCCLKGSGMFYVGTKSLPYREGDITLVTDREFHRCRSNPGTRSRWAWFFLRPPQLLVPHAVSRLTWEPERFSGVRFRNVLSRGEYPGLAALLDLLVTEAGRKDAHNRDNLRALFVLIISELNRTFPKRLETPERDPTAASLARIAPALKYVDDNFQEPLTIPDLAQRCGMSVRNFQLQFVRFMGMAPQAHVLRTRVRAAAALLADADRPVSDIAFSCGFNTLSSFNRAFRAAHHQSPREYRQSLTTQP